MRITWISPSMKNGEKPVTGVARFFHEQRPVIKYLLANMSLSYP